MPDPLPSKLGGLRGEISSDTAESNLREPGADAGSVPSGVDEPEAGEPGSMMDLLSLPKKENRRRSEVHIGIQAKVPAVGDDTQKIPERRLESEFGTLDDFDDPKAAGAGFSPVSASGRAFSGVDESVAGTGIPESVPEGAPDEVEKAQGIPVAEEKPARMPIGRVEWIALGLLGVLLVGLSVGAYFWSIRLLPEETPRWKSVDFPVKGARVEIKNAVTYWREPVMEGPGKDPVRRGVRLIPVVDMELSGGPVALRVIFRDEEGNSMGDPIFRSFSSSGKLALASTAGFEDPGMYAAYRTEDLEPWSVEISEASSADAPGSAYTLILKMNISSELR